MFSRNILLFPLKLDTLDIQFSYFCKIKLCEHSLLITGREWSAQIILGYIGYELCCSYVVVEDQQCTPFDFNCMDLYVQFQYLPDTLLQKISGLSKECSAHSSDSSDEMSWEKYQLKGRPWPCVASFLFFQMGIWINPKKMFLARNDNSNFEVSLRDLCHVKDLDKAAGLRFD